MLKTRRLALTAENQIAGPSSGVLRSLLQTKVFSILPGFWPRPKRAVWRLFTRRGSKSSLSHSTEEKNKSSVLFLKNKPVVLVEKDFWRLSWSGGQWDLPSLGTRCRPLLGMPGGSSGIMTQPPRERVSFLRRQPGLLMFCLP